jgi:hypothetical protein
MATQGANEDSQDTVRFDYRVEQIKIGGLRL